MKYEEYISDSTECKYKGRKVNDKDSYTAEPPPCSEMTLVKELELLKEEIDKRKVQGFKLVKR